MSDAKHTPGDGVHGWCFTCKSPCFILAGTCRGCAGRAVPVPVEMVAALEQSHRERDIVVARMGDAYTRAPETQDPESGDSLLDRLNGIYTVPVNDGAGPLNDSMTFTRRFPTLGINREAAAEIVRVRAERDELLAAAEALLPEVERLRDCLAKVHDGYPGELAAAEVRVRELRAVIAKVRG